MKTLFLCLVATGMLASCNTKTSQTQEKAEAPTSAAEAATPAGTASCYAYVGNKDTITLRITAMGNTVNGDLVYSLFEKDKNNGTIQGEMRGDTLLAYYRFMSEGTESVRQVAFLKSGDILTEGYAAVKQEGGRTVFEKTRDLKFTGNLALRKTTCPN